MPHDMTIRLSTGKTVKVQVAPNGSIGKSARHSLLLSCNPHTHIDVFGAVAQRAAAMEGLGDKRQRIVMSGLPVDPSR